MFLTRPLVGPTPFAAPSIRMHLCHPPNGVSPREYTLNASASHSPYIFSMSSMFAPNIQIPFEEREKSPKVLKQKLPLTLVILWRALYDRCASSATRHFTLHTNFIFIHIAKAALHQNRLLSLCARDDINEPSLGVFARRSSERPSSFDCK